MAPTPNADRPASAEMPSPEMPDLEIRRAREADAAAIQAFIGRTYGDAAPYKGSDRWRWQFVDNPFRPSADAGPAVWIAVCRGEVVGQIAVQDGHLWMAGQLLPAGWIVDVMIRSDWRGQGLGHRIHAAVMAEREILVTLTMAMATRRIAERAGCITLGPTGQYILPHRLGGATVARFLRSKTIDRPSRRRPVAAFEATRLGPALAAATARGIARLLRLAGRVTASGSGRIEEVDRFPTELDTLWQDNLRARFALFERSASFLNWRFADVPGLTYRRFLLRNGPEIAGYLVIRRHAPAELPVGVIADLLARPGDGPALDSLIAHAVAVLGPETEYLEAAASSGDLRAALGRAGFLRTRQMHPTVVVADPAVRARMAAAPDGWHFTKADHDWDQVHPVAP